MHLEALPLDRVIELEAQVELVLGVGAVEQGRAHPLLQDQPVAEIDSLDHRSPTLA